MLARLGSPEEFVALRVLVIEEDTVEALAIQRELGGRFDLRVAATLAEAMSLLTKSGWRPEVILANPTLPDSEGLATLRALQDAAAGTPIVVTTGAVTEGVRRQLDALVGVAAGDRIGNALATRSGFLHHSNAQSLLAYRIETIAEIDRVTRQAADAAVSAGDRRAARPAGARRRGGPAHGDQARPRLGGGQDPLRLGGHHRPGLRLPARDRRRHRRHDAARRLEVTCRRG